MLLVLDPEKKSFITNHIHTHLKGKQKLHQLKLNKIETKLSHFSSFERRLILLILDMKLLCLMKTLLLSVISAHLCPCAETGPTGILGELISEG